jgi:hypothetical protein
MKRQKELEEQLATLNRDTPSRAKIVRKHDLRAPYSIQAVTTFTTDPVGRGT